MEEKSSDKMEDDDAKDEKEDTAVVSSKINDVFSSDVSMRPGQLALRLLNLEEQSVVLFLQL